MGLTALTDDQLVKPEQPRVSLGDLAKIVDHWSCGLAWDPAVTGRKVDCDLWMVAINGAGEAIDLVHYDPKNPKARVVSPTCGLVYEGDDRDGSSSQGGYDEFGGLPLTQLFNTGARKVLLISNIYEPAGLTFSDIANAYFGVWPGDARDPEAQKKAKVIQLTNEAQGARCVIAGWLEWTGTQPHEVDFVRKPSHAPDIQTALAPFGVN